MDEFQEQAVRKRIFHRFTQWYYQGIGPTMECADAPELVALLQSAGFVLNSIGFGESTKTSRQGGEEGCKVIVECPTSGVRAELRVPSPATCRCALFTGTDTESVQEKASFWHVTTSQERLNTTNSGKGPELGSSLLPDLDPARRNVIREVLQILQEELVARPTAPHSKHKRHRFSATSSLSSINNSLDSLRVQSSLSGQQVDPMIERRASISCCENLPRNFNSETASLPPRSPRTWEAVSSSTLASSSEAVNSVIDSVPSALSKNNEAIHKSDTIVSHLNTIINVANDVIALVDTKKIHTKTSLIRTATFNVKDKEHTMSDTEVTRKKARIVVPSPLPPRVPITKTDLSRNRALKPPLSTPKSMTSAGIPKTDPIRRRTYNLGPPASRSIQRSPLQLPLSHSSVAESSVPTLPKVSRSIALFKRLGNAAAGNSKKKQPDAM